MAALMLEQDDLQLEEALAFLDTLECADSAKTPLSAPMSPLTYPMATTQCVSPSASETSDWGTTSGHTSDGSSCEEVSSPSRSAATTVSRREPKKMKKAPKNSKTQAPKCPPKIRKRKHNKTEILTLREEVLHLTARLAQRRKLLSVSTSDASTAHGTVAQDAEKDSNALVVTSDTTVSGVQLADCELHKLELAKTMNRRLKAALDKQMKLSSTLRKVFEKQIIMKEELELMEIPQVENRAQVALVGQQRVNLVADIGATLQIWMDEFYCSVDDVLASINPRNTNYVFNSNHAYQDPVRGKTVEFMTNAPLATPFYEVERCLWRHVSTMNYKLAQSGPAVGQKQGNSFERSYSTSISVNGVDIPTLVTFLLRRFEEPNRTVMFHVSLLEVEGTGIAFREIGCVVLAKAPSDAAESFVSSSSTTQFQTFYRIFAETAPVSTDPTSQAQINAMIELLLHALKERSNGNILKLQDGLVNQFPTVQAEVDLFGMSSILECNV